MRTDAGQMVRLEDYKPYPFLLHSVDLAFSLEPASTVVRAKLVFERRPDISGTEPLQLDGDGLSLDRLTIDGNEPRAADFTVSDDYLIIKTVPTTGRFTVDIQTTIDPASNTQLMGLYRSNDTYCTQCEAEGFRRITFFPDRPDVLSVYTVRIEGPIDECPLLLSNGNKVDKGTLADGRHYAVWHDPHPKPCYLFALVAGNLGCVRDQFTTGSGRDVALEIYVEHGKGAKAAYAMDALKRSMAWDEEAFGREYDLDVFMLVAVSDFNMGAMENKGLNIFNDKYVLADPNTATDQDYASIEAIVAHEYFHNWTGNRITCRDWFQLCLKEGLTVFRDHEFSADMRERAVKRIAEVRLLRSHQFPEDAGPLAHPVRPQKFKEINNFYTATVYEKGSEVVRMLKTILGAERFRRGIDLYFERHDGEAATIEDWLKAFEDASGEDLSQFALWYDQAGTPNITVNSTYDTDKQRFVVEISQSLRALPDGTTAKPMHIPLSYGLLGPAGAEMDLGCVEGGAASDGIIHLTRATETFEFRNVREKPVLSLLRGFSAPVTYVPAPSQHDLAFIARHETDEFARWDALNTLMTRRICGLVGGQAPIGDNESVIDILLELAADGSLGPAYRALCLTLPSQHDIAREMQNGVDPDAIYTAVTTMHQAIAKRGQRLFARLFHGLQDDGVFSPDAASAGRRALKCQVLTFLSYDDTALTLAKSIFETANTMTERFHALSLLTHLPDTLDLAQPALDAFARAHRDDAGVMDKWFSVQATRPGSMALERAEALTRHRQFSWSNPNRVRSVVGAFATGNPTGFNRADGGGYRFLCQTVAQLDTSNPQLASRLLTALRSWRSLEPTRKLAATDALKELSGRKALSSDVREMVDRILD